ncbi:MAG: GlsB/YeaQ/YmgE family stress response membrane protein [Chitinophagales bacterium]
MDPILYFLIIGAVAGWLAGIIMKGFGFGIIGNIIVGIIGALVGGWLVPQLGLPIGSGVGGQIITAVLGAVVFLFVVKLIK